MRKLKDYKKIVGEAVIDKIEEDAKSLDGRSIVHISSTSQGGGVAEILNSFVALSNDAGVKSDWRLLKAPPEFFTVTKGLHNALQGSRIGLTGEKKRLYEDTNAENASFADLDEYYFVMVHDPQPLPLIKYYSRKSPRGLAEFKKRQNWIWRCHIDTSTPFMPVWNYLKNFMLKYDAIIVSSKKFLKKMRIPQYVIAPSIDPLSDKNKEISEKVISGYLSMYEIPRDKPIVTQVSRFDYWKDYSGVLDAYKMIKREVDCRLVLVGSMAADDPEGEEVYKSILEECSNLDDVHIISREDSLLVNSLQRASSVVIQKSIREGFALTVSEALWKGRPVVASNVGGIPLQVIDGVNGYLVENTGECAKRTIELLKNPRKAEAFGRAGREHVRKKFLVTSQLQNQISLLKKLINNSRVNARTL